MSTLNFQPKKSNEVSAREISRPERSTKYQELPGLRHETKDVLQQLNANIQILEDLGGRLNFVMTEVRSVIRR